ncbi:unnamed protein product [Rotaria magnacalcarata]|uniref:Carboxylic ester hydrolase n=3 Tax=Rotaria magnacalcarata TaxID=392030 RepID=A0A818YTA2_9BILA|nr:unnamed protein product [Rotaria magnacalcarata]CAF2057235.1 unnamed protein product [Rotaria magnacalcarata]CAF2057307.1 unnamed protein product [Rotaria magnacalcarata]CAF2072837.1 unnamed protein product [Rotaria magnacalcarata]CAF3759098.1 unnamed protein product [Rotaria magnacalcarata]
MTIGVFVLFVLTCFTRTIYANRTVTVTTKYGDVLGFETDAARIFYGIPFAEPPVNDLRWEAPVAAGRWAPSVLNATKPPPACPQPECKVPPILCPAVTSEDCLYLNIFTPIPTQTSSPTPLPVMIFITGGNFQFLDASAPIYESERFVNTTNVIVVFIQYRLGILGFLATGPGPNDIKGNFGILDQRLAIGWVKDNINAFGGDPNEITLFGQSAGGQSIALHYVSSDMQSFFQRAIIQSAPLTIPFRTYAEYITPSVLLAEQLHCTVGDISCFRRASYQDIVVAQSVINNMITSLDILLFFEPWVPVIDHSIVHGQPLDLVYNTSFSLKQLIIGTLTEEAIFFVYEGWAKPLTPKLYAEVVVGTFREKALKVLERFPPDSASDVRPLLSRLATQWVWACSNRVFARKAASYYYAFGYPLDFDGWGNETFCNGHSCHGAELPFLFESTWVNFTDAGRRVSQSMATYWTNFATSQDPNEPARVSTPWPRVTTGNEQYMYFQDPLQVQQNYLKDDCDFWDKIGYKPALF